MSNTISNRTLLVTPKNAVIYMTLDSDGSEETDYVLYDSSVVSAAFGDTDTLDCTIMDIKATVVSTNAVAAALPQVKLEFDASTDIMALGLPANQTTELCFDKFGGLPNNAGSGKTGDILLTTTNLASGDNITIIMTVKRN